MQQQRLWACPCMLARVICGHPVLHICNQAHTCTSVPCADVSMERVQDDGVSWRVPQDPKLLITNEQAQICQGPGLR